MRSQSHERLWPPLLKLKFGNGWLTSYCCGNSCKKFNSSFQFQFQFQFQGFQFQFHFQFHHFQFQFQFRNWNWNWASIPIPELNWPQPCLLIGRHRHRIVWLIIIRPQQLNSLVFTDQGHIIFKGLHPSDCSVPCSRPAGSWKALPDGRPSLQKLCLRSFSKFYFVMAGGFYPPIFKPTRRFGGRVGGWLIHCAKLTLVKSGAKIFGESFSHIVVFDQRSLQNHHQAFHDRCLEKVGPLPKKSDHWFTWTCPENVRLASNWFCDQTHIMSHFLILGITLYMRPASERRRHIGRTHTKNDACTFRD